MIAPVNTGFLYFKFDSVVEGTWPPQHPTQPGAIVRQKAAYLEPLPTVAWNEETKEWAIGRWVSVSNPAEQAPGDPA